MSEGSNTIILQSHSFSVLRGWIGQCVDSVRDWAEERGYDYRFLGDEIFDPLPSWYREKTAGRMPIQADLARLYLLRDALAEGYETAVWMDADTLVFAPDRLDLSDVQGNAAFGREIWVDADSKGKLKAWRNTHNAACLFRQGNAALPFLIETTERIIERAEPDRIAPQMVGPKLLSAFDTIYGFEKLHAIQAFSPRILQDVADGGGAALDRLQSEIKRTGSLEPAAANLCASLIQTDRQKDVLESAMRRLIAENGLP